MQKKNELPPRTHNLLFLVDTVGIEVRDEDLEHLSQLNQFYLESRYPGERVRLAKGIGKYKAKEIFEKTQRMWKCLKQMLR